MDKSKVQAVLKWSQPTMVKELQHFLGFANFYRRNITNFSAVAASLTSMTKRGNSKLHWSANAIQAFNELKTCFTSAPILCHPDPDTPIVVEVDASNTGIGAILSQHQGNPLNCSYAHTTPVNSPP